MKIDKDLLKYILKGIALYLIWYIGYELWLAPDGRLDKWLNESVAYGGWVFVNLLGYDGCIEGTHICVNIVSTVKINNGCNGFEIYSVFAAFIILFEGKWLHKLFYIIGGIIIIYFSNILRVGMLAIDHYKNLKLFYFNHHYTYVFIIYGLVFLLWYIWITKFSKRFAVS